MGMMAVKIVDVEGGNNEACREAGVALTRLPVWVSSDPLEEQ